MPAVGEQKLSLHEFHARYDGEKPYYEYWDGEAVQKSKATLLHGLIQGILGRLLDDIGYVAASEVTLKLDPAYELVPDIIGIDAPIVGDYPTSPFEVVIETLSLDDSFSRVLRKCKLYETWEFVRSSSSTRRIAWSGASTTALPKRPTSLPIEAIP